MYAMSYLKSWADHTGTLSPEIIPNLKSWADHTGTLSPEIIPVKDTAITQIETRKVDDKSFLVYEYNTQFIHKMQILLTVNYT